MTITIKIATDNDAFADGNKEQEIARILKDISIRWPDVLALFDYNGNRVGSLKVTGK